MDDIGKQLESAAIWEEPRVRALEKEHQGFVMLLGLWLMTIGPDGRGRWQLSFLVMGAMLAFLGWMFVSTRGRQKRIEALFPELQPLARARLSRAVHLSRAAASACAMYAAYALHGYGVAAALWIALAAIGAIVAGREILAASRYSAPGRTEIKAVVSALLLGAALIALKGVDLWRQPFRLTVAIVLLCLVGLFSRRREPRVPSSLHRGFSAVSP